MFRKEADGTSGLGEGIDTLFNGPVPVRSRTATLGSASALFRDSSQSRRHRISIILLIYRASRRHEQSWPTPVRRTSSRRSPPTANGWLTRRAKVALTRSCVVSFPPSADQKGSAYRDSGGRQTDVASRFKRTVLCQRRAQVLRWSNTRERTSESIIKPEFLFDMHANVTNTRNSYVPSADGQRFLVNMRPRYRRRPNQCNFQLGCRHQIGL